MLALAVGRAAVKAGLHSDARRAAEALGWLVQPSDEDPGEPRGDLGAWLGGVHERLRGDRRRDGAHYTPASWSLEITDRALSPILEGLDEREICALRVVDPACGAGSFLLSAVRVLSARLAQRGAIDPWGKAVACVCGVDIDPTAVRLTRSVLGIGSGRCEPVGNVVVGDALTGPTWRGGVGPGLNWAEVFPEVVERGGFDAVVGNPPFLGGKRIRTELGLVQRDVLRARRPGVSGNADLAAHFVLLTTEILRSGGSFGLVLTDTIAQGATRVHGLSRAVSDGICIVRAQRSIPWPGSARVRVAVVHGRLNDPVNEAILDGEPVGHISSHLHADRPEQDPAPLPSRRARCFIGCDLKGPGFLLTPDQRSDLCAARPERSAVLPVYVTGADIVRPAGRQARRYVIDFTGLTEPQARERWPELMRIVEREVRPERSGRSAEVAAAPWWRFWRVRQRLRDRLQPLDRCLVAAVVSKHLIWDWQPSDRVFSHKVAVVAADDDGTFAWLQSGVFCRWAWALSSTLGQGMNFTPSTCFETFVPPSNALTLAPLGRQLWTCREQAREQLGVGLTAVRNLEASADPHPALRRLRQVRAEVDGEVRRLYRWPASAPPASDYARLVALNQSAR